MSGLNPLDVLGTGWNIATDIFKGAWGIFSQNKTWDREDTAVQRRVADLKAAGLNPVLAAGSAAQSGSPVSFGAPQGNAVELAATMAKMRQDISTSRSQQAYLEAQRRAVDTDTKLKEGLLGNKVEQERIDTSIKQATEQAVIAKTIAEASKAGSDAVIRDLQAQVDRLYALTNANKDAIIKNVEAQVASKTRLATAEAQKVLTITQAKALLYDYEWKSEKGMPIENSGAVQRAIGTVQTLLQRLFQGKKYIHAMTGIE